MKREISKDDLLEKYLEKLEQKKDLVFYNLKNVTFVNLIQKGSAELIQKCKDYEEDKKTRKCFENMEALNWIVELVR
jgi:hypothetical protein